MATTRLHVALKASRPELAFFARRRLGEVDLDWMAVARVVPVHANTTKVEWNTQLALENKIDRDAVTKAMAAAERVRPEIEWG